MGLIGRVFLPRDVEIIEGMLAAHDSAEGP